MLVSLAGWVRMNLAGGAVAAAKSPGVPASAPLRHRFPVGNWVGVVTGFVGTCLTIAVADVGLVLVDSAGPTVYIPGGLLIAAAQVLWGLSGCFAVKQDSHFGGSVPILSGIRPHAGIRPSPSARPPYQTSP